MTETANGETLYRFAHPDAFPPGQVEIPASIFNDVNMSCDWQRVRPDPATSAQVSQAGRTVVVSISICDAIRNPTNPKRIGQVVPDWQQRIFHDPVAENPGDPYAPNEAHALIQGRKKGAVVDAIRANSTMAQVQVA